jgi:hypothetical protein
VAQPEDFLAQAIKLLKAAGDLDYRVVIDRAYYGAYHAARQFEEALPHRSQVTTDKTGSHDGLFRCLECPNPKLDYGLKVISQGIGAQMRMLKPLRELASYELQETKVSKRIARGGVHRVLALGVHRRVREAPA